MELGVHASYAYSTSLPMLYAPSLLFFLVMGVAPVNSFLPSTITMVRPLMAAASPSTKKSARGVLSNICKAFPEIEAEANHVSLASDYRVDISSSTHGETETWFLTPITTILQDDNGKVTLLPEGAQAKRALEIERTDPVFRVQCIQNGENLVVTKDSGVHDVDAKLVATLGRIMVQRLAARQQEPSKRWTILLPDENPLENSNLCGEAGVLQLFQSITDTENVQGVELVEMVDRNSVPLGMVPRPLMHTFNLLHRGIGVVVAKDAFIDGHTTEFPAIYVHRRTEDKLVFPSMYVQESVTVALYVRVFS